MVTDRDIVLAMPIEPKGVPRAGDLRAALEELARREELRLGAGSSAELYPRLQSLGKAGLAAQLLTAERGDS